MATDAHGENACMQACSGSADWSRLTVNGGGWPPLAVFISDFSMGSRAMA